VALAVLVMQVGTPVAVTSYLLAEKYGADAGEVAGLVVVSTLISIITIPLTLAFFV
jgi:predicted permease